MTRLRPLAVATLALACFTVLGAWLTRRSPAGPAPAPRAGHTRTYYVAADEVDWDYLPGGVDRITGKRFADVQRFRSGPRTLSTVYHKALYREYSDSTFRTVKARPPQWEHLGYLGPVLRAEVGDTIRIVFRNHTDHPAGMHPHGVFYRKDSEGAPYEDGTRGADKADDAVPPGGTHVYVWPVPERAGPGPHDPSSIIWMYHSHTDEVADVNAGLIGPLIVTRRGAARPDGTPADVDRELVIMFGQNHEEMSWYASRNVHVETFEKDPPVGSAAIFPAFVKFSINGYVRGTLPLGSLTMRQGERVRWYVFASTGDFDFHSPHWHGNTVLANGMRTDVLALEPMEMLVADMVPDNPGTWFFHCHVQDHLMNGMQARFAVAPEVAAR
jgi:manganese oxidase